MIICRYSFLLFFLAFAMPVQATVVSWQHYYLLVEGHDSGEPEIISVPILSNHLPEEYIIDLMNKKYYSEIPFDQSKKPKKYDQNLITLNDIKLSGIFGYNEKNDTGTCKITIDARKAYPVSKDIVAISTESYSIENIVGKIKQVTIMNMELAGYKNCTFNIKKK